MDVGALSLRILDLDRVILHEGIDPRRLEELKGRLERDGVLHNPPMVAPTRDYYVVLDGATRVEALRSLGFPTILVQIVDPADPRLGVNTWHHLIKGMDRKNLEAELAKIPNARWERITEEVARLRLKRREVWAYLVFGDHQVLALAGGRDIESSALVLNQVVNLYRGRAEIFRVVTMELEKLLEEHENIAALVVFPQYTLNEILTLAASEVKLPTGITRFIIPGRVLRVDLDLEILKSARPLAEKNQRLSDYIAEAVRKKKIRYYQEPVYLFED